MKRILIIGESPFAPTRFGTTVRHIGAHLQSTGWKTAVLGFGYSGWPFKSPVVNYPLYPWIGPPTVPHNVEDVLDEWKPNTLLLIGAPLLFGWLKDYPKRESYRIVLNTTFKSLPINKMMRDIYGLADTIIVNSRYEETAVRNLLPDISVQYIPYGIDLKSLEKSKALSLRNNGQFGVACVTKDIPKIDFPSLLKAWGIVSKAYPQAAFGIFSDPTQLMAWNIPDMLEVYGIQQKMFIHSSPENNFGFSALGDLYASVDLLVLPHQEEMLNVTALEAAYCGTPMIVADGGATAEYLPEYAMRSERTDTFIAPPQNTRYTVFDTEELAEKIIMASLRGKRREKPARFIRGHCILSKVLKEWTETLGD